MHNEFTAIIEKDGEWFIAYCPEIPGANGQGRTKEECLQSLSDAISLILKIAGRTRFAVFRKMRLLRWSQWNEAGSSSKAFAQMV